MKTEKPYCRLSVAARELGCTPSELIEMGAAETLDILVCVPEGVRVRIYDAYDKLTQVPLLEPEFLSLSATYCRKIEIHGRTEQMDFREGYQVDPPGHFKRVVPQYGRPHQNHVWLYWRTCTEELFLPKAIDLSPEHLFIKHHDLKRLLPPRAEVPGAEQVGAKEQRKPVEQPISNIPEGASVTQISQAKEKRRDTKLPAIAAPQPPKAPACAPLEQALSTTILPSEDLGSGNPSKSLVFIRMKQVIGRTGLSKSAIYDKLDPKSPRHDPSFPKQRQLGIGAVAWVETEIDDWLQSRGMVSNR